MINEITKERFFLAYDKFPPNGWIKFAFKFFSKESEKKSLNLNNGFVFFLVGLFGIGFFCTVFNTIENFILLITGLYIIFLLLLIIYLFSAVILNNLRIKKIYMELGISRDEYNKLSKFYFKN
jgi:hypothetical protein